MTTRITYNACIENLGDNVSDQEYENYKALVCEALEEEFPAATVRVGDSDFSNASQAYVNSDDDELEMDGPDRVREIANSVFENGQWWEN